MRWQCNRSGKHYVSVKSCFERRASLELVPLDAKLKLIPFFMPRVKKKLSALSVWLSLGLLSPGFFFNGTFSWTSHVPPMLNAASRADASVVELYSPAKVGRHVDLKTCDEPTPRSESFLSAKQNAGFSLRSFTVFPFRLKVILAAKIPRYIFKSVLNI